MNFAPLHIRMCAHIDQDSFLALLDSESYATDNAAYKDGNKTLHQQLEARTKATEVDYGGHSGSYVYFTLDVDVNTAETLAEIEAVIEEHLQWCKTLELVDHVKERRGQTSAI